MQLIFPLQEFFLALAPFPWVERISCSRHGWCICLVVLLACSVQDLFPFESGPGVGRLCFVRCTPRQGIKTVLFLQTKVLVLI